MVKIRNCLINFLIGQTEARNFFFYVPQVLGRKFGGKIREPTKAIIQCVRAYSEPFKRFLVGLQKASDILYSKITLLKYVILEVDTLKSYVWLSLIMSLAKLII